MSKFIRYSGIEDATITEWVPPIIEKEPDATNNLHSGININSDFIDIDFSKKNLGDASRLDKDFIDNRDKGYDDGYEIGRYEAESLLKSEVKENLHYLKNNVARLHDPLSNLEANIEKELVELAILIAEKMVIDHIKHKPETIIKLIGEAIELLPNKNTLLTISINPEDLDFINEHSDSLEDFKCKFIENPQLPRGGMEIQSDDINIDLSLEKRMHDLVSTFFDSNESM